MAATKYPLFTEENSVEAVNARMGGDIDPRLREIMSRLDGARKTSSTTR